MTALHRALGAMTRAIIQQTNASGDAVTSVAFDLQAFLVVGGLQEARGPVVGDLLFIRENVAAVGTAGAAKLQHCDTADGTYADVGETWAADDMVVLDAAHLKRFVQFVVAAPTGTSPVAVTGCRVIALPQYGPPAVATAVT